MIVYCFTHMETGRKYVGITKHTIEWRLKGHMKGRSFFSNVLRKYGIQGFSYEIIDTASSTEELRVKEKKWIHELDTLYPEGFNLTDRDSVLSVGGYKLSEETRRAISLSRIGIRYSDESKKKISESLTGIVRGPQTAEHSRRISEALKGKKRKSLSPEHRKRLSEANKAFRANKTKENVS